VFTLNALDRPVRTPVRNLALRISSAKASPARTAVALNSKWAHFGGISSFDQGNADLLMSGACNCFWCGKSLGQKKTSSFDLLVSPKTGGTFDLLNLIVVCGRCLNTRPSLCDNPAEVSRAAGHSASKTLDILRRVDAVLANPSGITPKPVVHHQASPDGAGALFLVESKAAYVEALQHFKLTARQGDLELVAVQLDDASWHGLITENGALASKILKELKWGCTLVHWGPI